MRPTQPADAAGDSARPVGHDSTGQRTEDLYLRNYDPFQGYDLAVTVRDAAGETAFRRRYYFQPGEVESESGLLAPGEYEVTVELDNHRRKTVTCRVGPDPDETVHVELGNGAVSVTGTLY